EAKGQFVEAAEQLGEREAARRMRESPETFGALRTINGDRAAHAASVAEAHKAAREAASFGVEFLASRRELARVVAPQSPDKASSIESGLTSGREAVAAAVSAARLRLQTLGEATKRLPSRDAIEQRLAHQLR